VSHWKWRPFVINFLSNDIYFGCTPCSFRTKYSSPTPFPSFVSLALVFYSTCCLSTSFSLILFSSHTTFLFRPSPLPSFSPFFFVSPFSLLPPILWHKEKENGKREIREEWRRGEVGSDEVIKQGHIAETNVFKETLLWFLVLLQWGKPSHNFFSCISGNPIYLKHASCKTQHYLFNL